MRIKDAIAFFSELAETADTKRELRVYERFITLLHSLNQKGLNNDDTLKIEELLDAFDLNSNPENKRKFYSRKYRDFIKLLKLHFGFVQEGHYTGIGMVIGISLGIAIGSNFENSGLGLGIGLGIVFGLIMGAAMDSRVKSQDKVLATRNKVGIH